MAEREDRVGFKGFRRTKIGIYVCTNRSQKLLGLNGLTLHHRAANIDSAFVLDTEGGTLYS